MADSAQLLADRLRDFAILATEMSHDHYCHVHIRLDSGGLLVVASSSDGRRRSATVVPWPDVLAHQGAVSAAMKEMVLKIEPQTETD
jgi:hypothetical protein